MSERNHLKDPAAALRTFSARLGRLAPDWAAREEPERLHYRREDFSRDVAKALTLDDLAPLATAYGDALHCRFLLGAMSALDVDADLDEAALEKFQEITKYSPTVIFDFTLDKRLLLQSWLKPLPDDCRLFLYLFPEALERLLRVSPDKLRDLEQLLWGRKPTQKTLILVPKHEIWLDGRYLAVVGGNRVGQWRRALPQGEDPLEPESDAQGADDHGRAKEDLTFILETRAKMLRWDEPWVQSLTPLHLTLEGDMGSDEIPIGPLLEGHLVNLVMLHTADRTRGHNSQLQATYAGGQHSVDVPLLGKDMLHEVSTEGATALLEIFDWAYDPNFYGDKLPLVQVGVAQALFAADAAARPHLLLQNSPAIYEGLQYHWKALVESKVDVYVTQVQALEEYVGETVQAFADQVGDMIGDLTKTMLAAVGVVVGSFIGSLFEDTFNPAVFSLGMVAYALYAYVFPFGFGLRIRLEEFEALKEEFELRRQRFEALLYEERVEDIVAGRIQDSQERFERWFADVRRAYVILIALALLAGALALAVGALMSPTTATALLVPFPFRWLGR